MTKFISSVLLCLASLSSFLTQAQPVSPVPQHSCIKPIEPAKGAGQEAISIFNTSVRAYKSCLENHLGELEKLSAPYLAAANAASEEYNAYIKKIKFVDKKTQEPL